MTPTMMIVMISILAFVAIVGIGFAFAGGQNEAAVKRVKQMQAAKPGTRRRKDETDKRRKQTQQMLEKLREENTQRRKSIVPQDIKSKIAQAGLSIPVSSFWIFSFALGIGLALLAFVSGAEGFVVFGFELKSRPVVIIAAGLAGIFGFPRWGLNMLAASRNKKMTNQFADAIDIIVRGVKSGLPLTECLNIIARESPQPLGGEFERLTDSIQMGTTLEAALTRFYSRVPLPEVNFFVIVLVIQSKSGGNLSEALGNLSAVIRQRRMMREKIKALSSEAKASAMIIGALPFAVATMVYLTTPDYIMQLFITEIGHGILALGACLMGMGIFVMRNMINFDI
ncbi:MAG: type II secretion system F family protein [Pseudomonadota bacterium]